MNNPFEEFLNSASKYSGNDDSEMSKEKNEFATKMTDTIFGIILASFPISKEAEPVRDYILFMMKNGVHSDVIMDGLKILFEVGKKNESNKDQ